MSVCGWIRYLLAVDDEGRPMELSPDPMIPYMKEQLGGIAFGDPQSLTDQLKSVLSNESIFGTDLYQAGIGERIEEMVRSELKGPAAASFYVNCNEPVCTGSFLWLQVTPRPALCL